MRTREKEVHELKAKIAQLLAVMPSCHDGICLGVPQSNGSSILMLNDNQHQHQQSSGVGPSSPMSQLGLSISPLLGQLSNLGVLTSTPPNNIPSSTNNLSSSIGGSGVGVSGVSQIVQMNGGPGSGNNSNNSNNSGSSNGSNLDPNATAYTPKTNNSSLVGGAEA